MGTCYISITIAQQIDGPQMEHVSSVRLGEFMN